MKRSAPLRRISASTIFCLFFLLLIFSTVAASETAVQAGSTAIVNTGALNIRSGPGIGYGVVGITYDGHVVTLQGRNTTGSWVQIRTSSNIVGWVNTFYLDSAISFNTLPIVSAPALAPAAVVSTGALNVRSGPGVTYNVLKVVSFGESMALLGRESSNRWVKIQLGSGLQGWVNASLITPNITISSLPLADIPSAPVPPVPVAPNALLTLRSGPGFNHNVVGRVFQGQRVQAIARNDANNWVKVRVNESGLEGWIAAANVQLTIPITSLPIQSESGGVIPPTSPTVFSAIVSTGALNVRSGPAITFGVTAVVTQGTSVELLGRNSSSSWVKVRLSNGHIGWVNAFYITANTTISSLPLTN